MLLSADKVVLGLDIGGTQIRAGLARDHQLVASRSLRWPQGCAGVDEVHFVADIARDLLWGAGLTRAAAVGVSLAALVDEQGTVVSWPNRPSWQGLSVRRVLEARLGSPIEIEDDANAAALAEWHFGSGQGYRHLLVMMVGTGVGAGLILDGKLLRGRQGWAGELGHLVVQRDGPVCPCGHRGCLQMLASGRALERIAATHDFADVAALPALADQGVAWATRAIDECGIWLGLGAANVVNLLDLEAVVIGGGLTALGERWWAALEQTLDATILNAAQRSVSLHRAALSDTAGLLGAIELAHQIAH